MDDDRPIFVQIAEMIENAIIDGSLPEEHQAPSTNELAAFHRINPATAAKGFQQLVDEGILFKRRGIGMFVSPSARARLLEQRRTRFFDEVVDRMVDEARMIGIPLDEVIRYIEAKRGGDG